MLVVDLGLKFGVSVEVKTSCNIFSDKMNVVGYLFAFANLQNFHRGGPLEDVSIRVSEVQKLANELKNHPEFTLEGFKQTGYYRVGNVGKYLSQNFREYLYYGNVNPKDEGVMLTLHYSDKPPTPAPKGSNSDQEDGTLSYYIHKSDEDLSKEERKHLYRYMDSIKGNRDKRTMADETN